MSKKGTKEFGVVGYTSSQYASTRKNFPIKQQFLCISDNTTPGTPGPTNAQWILNGNFFYWFPLLAATPDANNHIVYEEGDEIGYVEPIIRPTSRLPSSNNPPLKSTGINDERIYLSELNINSYVYNNEIYTVTDLTFQWEELGLAANKNPYRSNTISKWKKASDVSSGFAPYWHHPTLKTFYPVPTSLSSAASSIYVDMYSQFNGEARDMNLQNFTLRQIEELIAKGASAKEAAEKVKALAIKNKNTQSGSGTQNNSGAQNNSNTQNSSGTQNTADNEVPNRSVVATIKKSLNARGLALDGNTNAQMIQYYRTADGGYSLTPDRFDFRYYPNNVSYSELGANWTEIERVNNTPFVDFKNFKLMKISFEFVVGDNTNLMTSIDDELKMLRQMATRPESVIFLGMDKMFSEQLIYPSWTGGSGIEFAIIDLTINSVQRVQQPPDPKGSASPRGEIARATCNMTIQELPLEGPNLIVLPKLAEVKAPQIPNTPEKTGTCRPDLWSNSGVTKNRSKNLCDNEQAKK